MLDKKEQKFFEDVTSDMDDVTATLAIHQLSIYLSRYYKKNVIILLDEYDTPMQEAYVNGYWDELAGFTRSMFNSTFMTNPYLERAMILEFKVQNVKYEKELSDTVEAALKQIADKSYETSLITRGIPRERIRKYGFAFCGKQVLIGTA